jgi:hypothetical protein
MNAHKVWDQAVHAGRRDRVHAAVLGRPKSTLVVCVHGLGCSHAYFCPPLASSLTKPGSWLRTCPISGVRLDQQGCLRVLRDENPGVSWMDDGMRTSAAKVPLGGAAKVPPRVKVVVPMAPSAPADGTLRNTDGAYKGLSAATAQARRGGWFPALVDGTRSVRQPAAVPMPAPMCTAASCPVTIAGNARRNRRSDQGMERYSGASSRMYLTARLSMSPP